jgi:hypothetical protein
MPPVWPVARRASRSTAEKVPALRGVAKLVADTDRVPDSQSWQ